MSPTVYLCRNFTSGKVHLQSRNNNDFSASYPAVAKALAGLPDETVVDGEVVAMDDSGRRSFNALQNYGSSRAPIVYYVFDIGGPNVMSELLSTRRELLSRQILPKLGDQSATARS